MNYKPSAEKYLRELATNQAIAEIANSIANMYKNRQMHELSCVLIDFVKHPALQEGNQLQKLFDQFIIFLENVINSLTYAQAIWIISKQFIKPEEALSFIDSIMTRLNTIESKLYLQIGKGYYFIKQDMKEEARELINACEKSLKENSNLDAQVHSFHYQLCALYYAKLKNYDLFYKYGLQYLAYTPEKVLL